jgi:hypothetical protein
MVGIAGMFGDALKKIVHKVCHAKTQGMGENNKWT